MQRVKLEEATEHLGELIDAATKGETILIVGNDEQAVQLTPVPPAKPTKRKAGSAAGIIVYMSDDFDAPRWSAPPASQPICWTTGHPWRDFYCSSPSPVVPQVHPPQLFHCPYRTLVPTADLSSRLFPFLSASSQMVGIC